MLERLASNKHWLIWLVRKLQWKWSVVNTPPDSLFFSVNVSLDEPWGRGVWVGVDPDLLKAVLNMSAKEGDRFLTSISMASTSIRCLSLSATLSWGVMSPTTHSAKFQSYKTFFLCHLNGEESYVNTGNTKGGSIPLPLTFCLTGLESAVWQLTIFVFIWKTD